MRVQGVARDSTSAKNKLKPVPCKEKEEQNWPGRVCGWRLSEQRLKTKVTGRMRAWRASKDKVRPLSPSF